MSPRQRPAGRLLADPRVRDLRPLPRWLYLVSAIRCDIEEREHITADESRDWLRSRAMTGDEYQELVAVRLWEPREDGGFAVELPG